MQAEDRAARIIGVLVILQATIAFTVNFVLEAPLFGAPGFLSSAAHYPRQIGLAAVLGIAGEALWVGIAITAFPIFRHYCSALTLWLAALAIVVLAVAVVENAAMMSMVSLSGAYAKAGAVDPGQLEMIRVVTAAARNWPHFLARMLDGCTIFVLYAVLLRSRLVPRLLAGCGLIAAVLQVGGVAMPLFGHAVVFPLLAPLGLVQLMLAVWLIARGFGRSPGDAPARE
jgi:hypothetical protein